MAAAAGAGETVFVNFAIAPRAAVIQDELHTVAEGLLHFVLKCQYNTLKRFVATINYYKQVTLVELKRDR